MCDVPVAYQVRKRKPVNPTAKVPVAKRTLSICAVTRIFKDHPPGAFGTEVFGAFRI